MMTENSSITKSHTFFATLGIALSVGLAPAKTHAATTFGFDESLSGLSSFILKADGITLTLPNLRQVSTPSIQFTGYNYLGPNEINISFS